MKDRNRALFKLKTTGLTSLCLFSGYGFYKMDGDPIVAAAFTFGLLGILMSFIRGNPSS